MSSTLVITLKSARTSGDLARLIKNTSDPRGECRVLEHLFERLASGLEAGSFDVQTGAVAPVAATNTMTGVSVVATDAVAIGGVTFTYTASPTLETDVMVTVPTASVLASSTDISTASGNLLETAHGFVTGDVGRMTTSSALPTGFATSTDYFVIKVSADIYKLASSLANAQAGVAIIPSTTGTGNQTFTLTANTYKACQLANAINAHSTIGQIITATYAAGVVTLTAKQKGVVANFIACSTTSGATITTAHTTMSGGTGGATSAATNYSRGL